MATKKKMLQAAAGVSTGLEGAWDLSYAYYDDPNAWDLSTARYADNFRVSGQETGPRGIAVSTDGTKMYVVGVTGDDVNQYTLSTPFRASTATYVQNFSVISQAPLVSDIFFKPDGTKMYICGTSSDRVHEYDLSTEWDISTASYLQSSLILTSQVNGVFIRSDGLKMYTVDTGTDRVYEYDLSTAWDVSTASSLQNFSVVGQESLPEGLSFKSDGTKMFVLGNSGNDVTEYDLSTAWDISTATASTTFSVGGQDTNPRGLFIDAKGGNMYVAGTTSLATVYQYSMGGFSVAAEDAGPRDVFFKDDGTRMYVLGVIGDDVNEYDLSIAWDTSTATYSQNFSIAGQETVPSSLFFKPDGTKMYISGSLQDKVHEYNLSTTWNISTAVFSQSFSVQPEDGAPFGLFFKGDGTKMYVVGDVGNDVNEYNLSTAWDISTASYLQNFSVISQESLLTGLFFKDDGTKMYVLGYGDDNVNEYDLSAAWDISTASFNQSFYVGLQEPIPMGLFFKGDGTQMFIAGQNSDRVHTYSLGVQE